MSIDLNQFYEWQQEKPETRSINIEANKFKGLTIWAYDYSLMVGQLVTSAEEIDLEAAKEAKERAQFEALKAKFERRVS